MRFADRAAPPPFVPACPTCGRHVEALTAGMPGGRSVLLVGRCPAGHPCVWRKTAAGCVPCRLPEPVRAAAPPAAPEQTAPATPAPSVPE